MLLFVVVLASPFTASLLPGAISGKGAEELFLPSRKVLLSGEWTKWTHIVVQSSKGILLVPTAGEEGGLFAVDAESEKIQWKAKIPHGAIGLAAKDVTGDGVEDAFVPTREGLYLVNGRTGKAGKIFDEPLAPEPSPLLYDVNKDGKADIGVAANPQPGIWEFVLLDGVTYQPIWRANLEAPLYATPTLWDINKDGVEEVLIVNGYGKAMSLNGTNGKRLWENALEHRVDSAPVVAKLSGKGEIGLGFGTYDKTYYMIDVEKGTIIWKYRAREAIENASSLADIDGDGFSDVVFCDRAGWVYAVKGNTGQLLWNSLLFHKKCTTTPLVIDYNADGLPDVWAGDSMGWLYILAGRGPVVTSLRQFPAVPTILATPVFFQSPSGRFLLALPSQEKDKPALLFFPLQPQFSPSPRGWWKYLGPQSNAG
ncbi:MAG: outer membrane protein assembly factor BamB family protein [bacterium JZ-2024 1]